MLLRKLRIHVHNTESRSIFPPYNKIKSYCIKNLNTKAEISHLQEDKVGKTIEHISIARTFKTGTQLYK